ncbi:DUF2326 domain-containing protein [Tepidimonas charontis]|uniref:DUF2326 domain-containing protein n=1 Tax=Tepidimonas charontis TaxID=2267262 RepID=A0A554X9H5_9BURK|nr:DUF2326 domain-containing protein [Tepidimonas charontis]TSE32490.1 hypothetical protein Tchar_02075 [Tepidimonas charontis]
MRLLRLSCDRPSFKTLTFRLSGLSVLVGDAQREEGSANGVGKTLALRLVHHCLGARRRDELARGVGDWRFALEFELAGQTHRIERNGDGADITLDGQSIGERSLRGWLDAHGPFVLPPRGGLSFRSLYRRFARVERQDLVDPVTLGREEAHQGLVHALHLLGLDIELALAKIERRDRLLQLDDNLKLLKQADSRLHELLRTGMATQAQIAELENNIAAMQRRLDAMQVADDYEQVRQQAQQLTEAVREYEAQLARIDYQLQGIERCLGVTPDIAREEMLGFYRGLQHVFKPEALAHFEAVESFHRSLAEQRQRRLERDRIALQQQRQQVERARREAARQRDEAMAYLGQRHAMGDYVAVAQRLAQMRADVQRLRRYEDAKAAWEKERIDLEERAAEDNRRASEYLATRPIEWADRRFRELIHTLYPNEHCGIALENNLRPNNRLRYNLKVQVQSQNSDGVNAARIIAFDWLLYRHGAHHAMRHLWHDNGLFDHIDPHQRAAWIAYAMQTLRESDMQYIVSINTENFASMRDLLAPQEALALDASVVIRLLGDADEHKLLGVRIGVG